MQINASEIGRKRLMLKLPHLRRELALARGPYSAKIFAEHQTAIAMLDGYRSGERLHCFLEAFEEMCDTLEREVAGIV